MYEYLAKAMCNRDVRKTLQCPFLCLKRQSSLNLFFFSYVCVYVCVYCLNWQSSLKPYFSTWLRTDVPTRACYDACTNTYRSSQVGDFRANIKPRLLRTDLFCRLNLRSLDRCHNNMCVCVCVCLCVPKRERERERERERRYA